MKTWFALAESRSPRALPQSELLVTPLHAVCHISSPRYSTWLLGRHFIKSSHKQFQYLSAYARQLPSALCVPIEHRALIMEAGFDMFVPKPVNPRELQAVIVSLLTPA